MKKNFKVKYTKKNNSLVENIIKNSINQDKIVITENSFDNYFYNQKINMLYFIQNSLRFKNKKNIDKKKFFKLYGNRETYKVEIYNAQIRAKQKNSKKWRNPKYKSKYWSTTNLFKKRRPELKKTLVHFKKYIWKDDIKDKKKKKS